MTLMFVYEEVFRVGVGDGQIERRVQPKTTGRQFQGYNPRHLCLCQHDRKDGLRDVVPN